MDKQKLRYAILKEIDQGEVNVSEKHFDVSEDEFDNAVRYLTREDFLKGIFYADNRPQFGENSAYLTEKGEKYLEENSIWGKTYRGLKEARDWIK